MIETTERVNLLRKIHLFHGVSEDGLNLIAGMLIERRAEAGQNIDVQGKRGSGLYLIHDGRVRIERSERGKVREQVTLTAGDYFGEEALLTSRPASASAIADSRTRLLVMATELYGQLKPQIPHFKATLEVATASHKLARKLDFKWLAEGEAVHFVAHKHWVMLLQSLLTPVLLAALPIFLAAWGLVAGAFWGVFLGGLLSFAVLAWIVWNIIDWGNDFYVVTNQRVVWLEKVIGLYDSRQEAPLSTLLSVGVETDLIGRLLNYGNVVVRTFVGQIRFNAVVHPNVASNLISEQWERTKEVASVEEKEAMKKALVDKFRTNLGLSDPAQPVEATPARAEQRPGRHKVVISVAGLLGGNLFKVRFEEGGTITYRKHWFVLFKQGFQPTAFLLVVVAWIVYRMASLLLSSGSFLRSTADGRLLPDTLLLSLTFLLVPLALWWAYRYLDWRNDIFQVTADQILDIDKKPFGTEQRRVALLDNILSTQSSRIGLAGYLLNFGTVNITVGGAHMAFEDVSDPASVQADIDRRRAARLAQKRQGEAGRDRERMADWLISYHDNSEELRRQQGLSADEPTSE